MRAPQFVVACDFDGTIHNTEARQPGFKMGIPFPGAREALERMRELGARIVIHTCRANPVVSGYGHETWTPGDTTHVADWLDYFNIPFDEITAIKPVADVYVDDRAIPFLGDWQSVERELLTLFYLGRRS